MSYRIIPLVVLTLLLGASVSRADDDNSGGNQWNWLQNLGNSGQGSSDDNQPTNVAGVRGLEETSKNVDMKSRDYAAIDRLDKLSLSDDELKKFAAEGGLK